MVQEHRGEYLSLWLAVESIAPKIGCVPQTLLTWVKRQEIDSGVREGTTTADAQRMKELERGVEELRVFFPHRGKLPLQRLSCGTRRQSCENLGLQRMQAVRSMEKRFAD